MLARPVVEGARKSALRLKARERLEHALAATQKAGAELAQTRAALDAFRAAAEQAGLDGALENLLLRFGERQKLGDAIKAERERLFLVADGFDEAALAEEAEQFDADAAREKVEDIDRELKTVEVASGGRASDTTVSSGGTMNVFSGSTASGVSVGKGGTLNVSSGGVISALTTNDRITITAKAYILSGGTVDGSTKIDGGQLILHAGAVFQPHAKLTIMNDGELVLEQDSFKGTIQDFGG